MSESDAVPLVDPTALIEGKDSDDEGTTTPPFVACYTDCLFCFVIFVRVQTIRKIRVVDSEVGPKWWLSSLHSWIFSVSRTK